MNILNFHNILALLAIHDFSRSVKIYQCTKEKASFFKNTTEIEIPQSVNGDDSSDNAS